MTHLKCLAAELGIYLHVALNRFYNVYNSLEGSQMNVQNNMVMVGNSHPSFILLPACVRFWNLPLPF